MGRFDNVDYTHVSPATYIRQRIIGKLKNNYFKTVKMISKSYRELNPKWRYTEIIARDDSQSDYIRMFVSEVKSRDNDFKIDLDRVENNDFAIFALQGLKMKDLKQEWGEYVIYVISKESLYLAVDKGHLKIKQKKLIVDSAWLKDHMNSSDRLEDEIRFVLSKRADSGAYSDVNESEEMYEGSNFITDIWDKIKGFVRRFLTNEDAEIEYDSMNDLQLDDLSDEELYNDKTVDYIMKYLREYAEDYSLSDKQEKVLKLILNLVVQADIDRPTLMKALNQVYTLAYFPTHRQPLTEF